MICQCRVMISRVSEAPALPLFSVIYSEYYTWHRLPNYGIFMILLQFHLSEMHPDQWYDNYTVLSRDTGSSWPPTPTPIIVWVQ